MGGAAVLVRSSLRHFLQRVIETRTIQMNSVRSPPVWEIWNLARYTVHQQIEWKKGISVVFVSTLFWPKVSRWKKYLGKVSCGQRYLVGFTYTSDNLYSNNLQYYFKGPSVSKTVETGCYFDDPEGWEARSWSSVVSDYKPLTLPS